MKPLFNWFWLSPFTSLGTASRSNNMSIFASIMPLLAQFPRPELVLLKPSPAKFRSLDINKSIIYELCRIFLYYGLVKLKKDHNVSIGLELTHYYKQKVKLTKENEKKKKKKEGRYPSRYSYYQSELFATSNNNNDH